MAKVAGFVAALVGRRVREAAARTTPAQRKAQRAATAKARADYAIERETLEPGQFWRVVTARFGTPQFGQFGIEGFGVRQGSWQFRCGHSECRPREADNMFPWYLEQQRGDG